MTYHEFINEIIDNIDDQDYILVKNNDIKLFPSHGLIYRALFQVLDEKVTISIEDLLRAVRYEDSPKEGLQLFYQIIFTWNAYHIKGGAKRFESDLKYVISTIKK